jgi:gas vesicle protein
MNNQVESANEPSEGSCRGSTFTYLIAGLGIGAAVSVFLAPKSGKETRKWIAGKSLNAIDAANEKVRESRVQVREFMDRGQQKIHEAVAAGREAIAEPKVAAN